MAAWSGASGGMLASQLVQLVRSLKRRGPARRQHRLCIVSELGDPILSRSMRPGWIVPAAAWAPRLMAWSSDS